MVIAHDAAAIATASADGTRECARASSTFWERSRTSSDGMSMRTGHTSKHAPHSVEAYGNVGLSLIPVSCGESTAPIGPGYTEPYACPPVRS